MKSKFSLLTAIPILSVLIIGMNACTEEEQPPAVDNLFFVEFVIDGDTVYYEDGEENYGNGPGMQTYSDSLGRLYSQYTVFRRSALTPNYEDNVFALKMVKFFSDTLLPSYNSQFLIFDEGSYDYGSWNPDTSWLAMDGVIISYTDNDGKLWSSDTLYGDQTGSESFEITSHRAVDENQFGAKTKGTFNCRVFDGLGGFLELESGSFHARTIHDQ